MSRLCRDSICEPVMRRRPHFVLWCSTVFLVVLPWGFFVLYGISRAMGSEGRVPLEDLLLYVTPLSLMVGVGVTLYRGGVLSLLVASTTLGLIGVTFALGAAMEGLTSGLGWLLAVPATMALATAVIGFKSQTRAAYREARHSTHREA